MIRPPRDAEELYGFERKLERLLEGAGQFSESSLNIFAGRGLDPLGGLSTWRMSAGLSGGYSAARRLRT